MPVLDIEPGQNPNAPGVLSFGSQGRPPGFLVDSEGNLTLLGALIAASQTISGNLAVTGDLTVGDDATVTDDLGVGGDVTVSGIITVTGQIAATDAVNVRRTNSFDNAYSAAAIADATPRYQFSAEGNMQWGNGVGATDTNLYRASTSILQTDSTLAIGTAGSGLRIKEGANARMGISTLVAGTVVVANTSIGANTRIFLTCQVPGGTPGFLRVSARAAGTSFTILSSSGTDTSQVGWLLLEPA